MTPRFLLSAAALMAVGTVTGRLAGIVREMTLAAQFGDSTNANVAIALLIIPDIMAHALIGVAVSAALIPAFAKRGEAQLLMLFVQSLLACMLMFSVAALVIFWQEERLLSLLAHEEAEASKALAIMLLSLPINAAIAVFVTFLQFRGRLMAPAFANTLLNGVIIAMLWLAPGSLVVLAAGIVIGSLIRLATHIFAFYRAGGKLPTKPFAARELDKPVIKAYGATVGSGMMTGLVQYAPYAAVAATGGIAVFNYAFKLALLPGLLSLAVVQMILLPWFTHLLQQADAEKHARHYSIFLSLAWVFSLCVCLAMSLASNELARLCFGYGRMTEGALMEVSYLFSIGVWAMPGMLLVAVWQQILYANEKVRMPLYVSLLQGALIIPFCWLGYHSWGAAGIIAAYAFVQIPGVILLALEGRKLGLVKQLAPSRDALVMTLVALITFLPLAWLFKASMLRTWEGVAFAVVIGGLSLAAGLLVSPSAWALIRALKRP